MALSPSWDAWLSENLLRGVPEEALVRALVAGGVAAEEARAEVSLARRHPAVVAGGSRTTLGPEVVSLLDVRSALHAQSRRTVERRRGVSAEEFQARYYRAHRPVVLEDFLEGWPLLERWRPAALARDYGDVEVEVMAGREARADHDVSPDACRTVMRLGDFLHRLEHGGPSNDLYLTARNFALERPELQGLWEDLRPAPGFVYPTRQPGSLKLWVGPEGTRTALHHDVDSVLFCQVHGRKRFWLVPSHETPRLYNREHVWSPVDAAAPDLERFPDFARAHVHEVVVGPGEMLFIPVGWWHQVLALDVSVSLTFQSLDVPGGNARWHTFG
ncbi:cupin-like domain-containing protein [Corallococcus sp. AB049A]|uniref:Cupin-like domain-containing protein n=1 Tax=Corallococcus interemptor TaxID=2316720 RepID=A0A3A8PWM5_9BACT|nr:MULTISPECIES: cupin-like domain-containing protein [Corallococcus]RKH50706.1 cupin-like domain-containing protein [Corallococcus sp. AB050B]RKH60398.1 cupin-like domain-containing protein [Corallococcus interemptor]RKI66597.1 cupin-like domain-containing protein [Corallococcus sp. AB049A]